jgi:hypothetical protein
MDLTEQGPSPCLSRVSYYFGLFIYVALLFAIYSTLGDLLTKFLTAMLEARSSYRELPKNKLPTTDFMTNKSRGGKLVVLCAK